MQCSQQPAYRMLIKFDTCYKTFTGHYKTQLFKLLDKKPNKS